MIKIKAYAKRKDVRIAERLIRAAVRSGLDVEVSLVEPPAPRQIADMFLPYENLRKPKKT